MCLFLSRAGLALSVRRAPHCPSWDPAVGESCLSQSSCGGGQAPRPRARSSQGRRQPKASCGRNLTAQPFGPHPPPRPLPCLPHLAPPFCFPAPLPSSQGLHAGPRPRALQTFSPAEVWGPSDALTALMGTRPVSPPGLGLLQAPQSRSPRLCWVTVSVPLSRQQGAPAVPASDRRPLASLGSQASSACSCRWRAGVSPGLRSPSPAARSFALSALLLFGPVSGRGKYSSCL